MNIQATEIKNNMLRLANEQLAWLNEFIKRERSTGTPDNELWSALNEAENLKLKLKKLKDFENEDILIKKFSFFLTDNINKRKAITEKLKYAYEPECHCSQMLRDCEEI